MPSQVSAAGCIVVGLALLAGHAAADPVARRIVALSGTDGPLGPGLGPGLTFSYFGTPSVDLAGAVAFRGVLQGPGVSNANQAGIWRVRDESPTMLIRARQPLPEISPTAAVYSIDDPNMAQDGRIALIGRYRETATNQTLDCFWTERTANTLELIPLDGVQAPAPNDDITLLYAESVTCGANGDVSLHLVGLRDLTVIHMHWMHRDGQLEPVAIPGHPGPHPTVQYSSIYPVYNLAMNPRGDVAFNPRVLLSSGLQGFAAILQLAGEDPSILAYDDGPAPGAQPGVVFHWIFAPTINTVAKCAFDAIVEGPGIDGMTAWGIWTNRTGFITQIARGGQPAPGLPDGLFNYAGLPAIDDAARIAFYGYDLGNNTNGYWIDNGHEMAALVLDGAAASGVSAGERFDIRVEPPMLNNTGQAAILSGYESADGVNDPADLGLWVFGINGRHVMALRTGLPIEVEHGDVRLIAEILRVWRSPSPSAGLPRSFNDDGTIVATVTFTDGSSAIIAATPLSFCSADTNGDGLVNFADINEVLGAFNNAVLEPHYDFDADLDFDGKVDFADLNLVISQLGDDCGG